MPPDRKEDVDRRAVQVQKRGSRFSKFSIQSTAQTPKRRCLFYFPVVSQALVGQQKSHLHTGSGMDGYVTQELRLKSNSDRLLIGRRHHRCWAERCKAKKVGWFG